MKIFPQGAEELFVALIGVSADSAIRLCLLCMNLTDQTVMGSLTDLE